MTGRDLGYRLGHFKDRNLLGFKVLTTAGSKLVQLGYSLYVGGLLDVIFVDKVPG